MSGAASIGAFLARLHMSGYELLAVKMAYAACDSVVTHLMNPGVVTFEFSDKSSVSFKPAE